MEFSCRKILLALVFLVAYAGGHQNLPPGVHPQHYQQGPAYQVPVQHVPMQQVPVQQVPIQQGVPMQQQGIPMQQQGIPMQQQGVPMQQQHIPQQVVHQAGGIPQDHGHHGQPQVLNVANIAHEKEHIQEHLSVPIDTSKMSEQELQFHYFKMHDADNNNKLDGCELIKSLIHWHEQGQNEHGKPPAKDKLFKDEELVSLIDPILALDDVNSDGYIDYPEFVRAQQKAAAAQAQQPKS